MIRDADTAEHLCRAYGLGCKRQVLDRDYYETFNRDDVTSSISAQHRSKRSRNPACARATHHDPTC
jgi:cation diffusion facilitator CzcD-associated flavoprotein CzcO